MIFQCTVDISAHCRYVSALSIISSLSIFQCTVDNEFTVDISVHCRYFSALSINTKKKSDFLSVVTLKVTPNMVSILFLILDGRWRHFTPPKTVIIYFHEITGEILEVYPEYKQGFVVGFC